MTFTPDIVREALVAYLMRAGHFKPTENGRRHALSEADDLILTMRYPDLRWDLDPEWETPEHRRIRASEVAS